MEEIYSKKNFKYKLKPNLEDYESAYKSFLWKDHYDELEWFPEGKLNAAYNAIDRHLKTFRKNKVALYWEGESGDKQKYTFDEISRLSNQFGNYLKSQGVERGHRVFIFLPRVPYLFFAFLGILKIGAIAGTLFSAFQEQALFDRLDNSNAEVLITNSVLAERVKKIKHKLPHLKHIILVDDPKFISKLGVQSEELHIAHMDPDDYAFMLYTSGTTGKPKGVVHRHLAVLSEHLTAKYVLDLHDEDTYWCTADPGWVTGIAYEILGSWSNGVTSLVYEGRFDADKWYQLLQDYKVNIWYTAPTAVRMLMAQGTEKVRQYDLTSLRHILSVGEPLNPEAIRWGIEAFGLAFHDTWWQTETGAITMCNLPATDIKLGSMGRPFLGMVAEIVDDKGIPLPVGKEGNLAIQPGWPSMMKTIWHRHVKYESYFINNWYISGDRAWKDKDGYFWFLGRADDVIKTAGERVGPFEVESALVEHPAVVEAGVIGKPDAMRGEIIKAFVVLKQASKSKNQNAKYREELKEELSTFVKKHLAGHAYPREIEFIDKLPKTRSGKIMRRILKAQEMGLPIGDTSTLEEY
ncbi:MAG: Acetyl-CoA synthetase [Candidatus Gottesmanbacteria bacterium GW2011_GWC2_39_8]|uniref:acetate--CoA ligase n=1 Tax=Candidatus Gottesmanbacteria bacterium GW2011_GWC2_39_8 TaxID=1618450 RepID=A0A0G0T0G8_9BACT|nr:MAG: Acetyl-CoA synthetase [Candidatus Gottesmanbacteria bacterium GW2011_GWC2_39_8]